MTNRSATLISCPAQPRQLRLEQPPDLLAGDAARAQFLHRGRDDHLPGPKLVGHAPRPRIPGDERAGAVAQLDDAFVLELPVGFGHGVRVDHKFLRQRTDAGQLLARAERARFDAVLHLLHQLEVDGNAGRGIGPKEHRHETVRNPSRPMTRAVMSVMSSYWAAPATNSSDVRMMRSMSSRAGTARFAPITCVRRSSPHSSPEVFNASVTPSV